MGTMGAMRDDGAMTDTTRSRTQRTSRLERSREDRILTGVSGGLGRHLGINPWWFRLAFMILVFFGGFGLLVYLAAWLVIPDEGHEDPLISEWLGRLDTHDGGVIFGLVLIGASLVFFLTQFADVPVTLVVAAILFIVGLMLYRGDLTSRRTAHEVDRSSGATTAEEGDDHMIDDTHDEVRDVPGSVALSERADEPPPAEPAPSSPPLPPPPPPAPRERSMLGRLTIAVGLIVLASMALVDVALDSFEIQPVAYFATAVGIVGLGLIVGTWIGRARWLIIVAVILLPAMWFLSLLPNDFDWSAGEVLERPTGADEVATPYELGFGQLTIDLRALSAEELAEVGAINASVGFGEIVLRLPNDVGVELTADVGMGAVQGPFDEVNGVGIDTTRVIGPDPVVMEINAAVGGGVVTVRTGAGLFEGSGT